MHLVTTLKWTCHTKGALDEFSRWAHGELNARKADLYVRAVGDFFRGASFRKAGAAGGALGSALKWRVVVAPSPSPERQIGRRYRFKMQTPKMNENGR